MAEYYFNHRELNIPSYSYTHHECNNKHSTTSRAETPGAYRIIYEELMYIVILLFNMTEAL